MHLTFLLALTTSCLIQVFSIPVATDSREFNVDPPQEGPNGGDWETEPDSPVYLTTVTPLLPADPTCSCTWTEWINADRPTTDANDGDWETLGNIRAQGFHVCQDPENINCRSVRFPYIPFEDLKYNAQCEKSTGLNCLNKDNDAPCIDFEVQFFCCSCEEAPYTTVQIPTESTHSWKKWSWRSKGKRREVREDVSWITASCPNVDCTWTEWFNIHHPTPGPHGGDFENVTEITKWGYSVCTAPQEVECRLVRFPYVPLDHLYYIQECTTSHGLVCLNENQENGECPDYEVRFSCCNCDANVSVTPKTETLVMMNNALDETEEGSGMIPN